MSFHALVEHLRGSRLHWKKEDGWLPSGRSEQLHVPYAWVATELCALMRCYPGGVTMAIAVTELQRKWNENNHVWGRNLAGANGSVALVQQSGSVPFEGILELQLVSQEQNSWTMQDWRGHTIECLMCEKMGKLGLVSGMSLLRMTALRTIPSLIRGRVRLLPTQAFTVLVKDEADLVARKEGNVLARVKSVGKSHLVSESMQTYLTTTKRQSIQSMREYAQVQVDLVIQTASPQPGKLLLSDDYLLIASLLKPRDLLVIQDAEIITKRGGVLLYRMGADSCIFQCPADPAASSGSGSGSSNNNNNNSSNAFTGPAPDASNNLHRLGRVSIFELPNEAVNSTVLVQIVQVKAARTHKDVGTSLIIEVRDVGGGQLVGNSVIAVYCWDPCREVAASLWEGQLALLKNLVTKKGKLHLAGSEAAIVPVSFRGWLASPGMHVFSTEPAEVQIARGALLLQSCAVKWTLVHVSCMKEMEAQALVCPHCGSGIRKDLTEMIPLVTEAIFDNGLQRYCLRNVVPSASAVLAHAQKGSLWDICISPSSKTLIECIPSHSVQICTSLLKVD